MNTITQISNALQKANEVLVVTHVSPDGDAIGSLTAMGQALIQMGKKPTLVCDDSPQEKLRYLPLFDYIQRKTDPRIEYDLLIALDCGDERRMGNAYHNLNQRNVPIINIDHHITNSYFGSINLVDTRSNSTTEILTSLFQALEVEITPEIAMSLLTGLVTDTLGFRTSSVTSKTLKVASMLMDCGANLADITREALVLKSYDTLLLWRLGLNKMKLEDHVAWTTISLQDQKSITKDAISSHGLGNLLTDVYEVAMSAVFTEKENNRIVVGFRSRPPYDVAELAAVFGGGGHRYASGCTIEGPLGEVETLVITRAKEMIAAQIAEGV